MILLSLLAAIIYATIYFDAIYLAAYQSNVVPLAEYGPRIGQAIFLGTILLLLAIFSFVAPAFGAGAIAGERERQTYDTLLLTSLRGKQIVWGKSGAILTLLLLFILASYPIQSVAYFFGGVDIPEIFIGTVALLLTGWSLSALGLFISSLVRTTTIAVSIAYAILVPLIYGVPFLIFYITEGSVSYFFDSLIGPARYLFETAMIFMMSLNPFFTAILTAEAATRGNGYFLYKSSSMGPINFDTTRWLISPWLIYAVCYLIFGWLLMWAATRRLDRISQH